MWDLIVPVPDHCLSFYFTFHKITLIIYITNTFHVSKANEYA